MQALFGELRARRASVKEPNMQVHAWVQREEGPMMKGKHTMGLAAA